VEIVVSINITSSYKTVMKLSIVYLLCLVQVSVDGSMFKHLNVAWKKSVRQAFFEQDVEDLNALHKIDNHLVRRLIVMPLKDVFKPNEADMMHGKIQYGDKCSLPTSIGRLLIERRTEVPWIFEIKPVQNTVLNVLPGGTIDTPAEDAIISESVQNIVKSKSLTKAYISPLDFRSPENYIFLPKWLMNDLSLNPNDLVDISFVRIKLADLVVFQPLSPQWDALMTREGVDPKALLEHEINKYSSLTAGSTISIEIRGVEYPLYVKKTVGEGGIAVHGVRVQDSDIRTDIDRSVLDRMIEEKKQNKV
jgi:hypothetical protein